MFRNFAFLRCTELSRFTNLITMFTLRHISAGRGDDGGDSLIYNAVNDLVTKYHVI